MSAVIMHASALAVPPPCRPSAVPGHGAFAPQVGCLPSYAALVPSLKWPPLPRNRQPLKSPCVLWTADRSTSLPTVARLRDRSGNDKPKPDRSGPKPSSPTVKAPTFKGLEPEKIHRWLDDAGRRHVAVRVTDLLAALHELRSAGSTLEDPKFVRLLDLVWARWDADPALFTNRDMDTLARNLAKVGGEVSKRLEGMEREAITRSRYFNGKETAGILWSFATAGRGDAIFGAMDNVVVKQGFGDFSAQGISNTAWAFATAGRGRPELFAAMESELLRRSLKDFVPQDFANLLWAFAKVGAEAPGLFAAVEKELLARHLGFFAPQGLVNLAWAFATAGRGRPELFAAMESELLRRSLKDFLPQHLANLLWAFAKVGAEAPGLFAAMEKELLTRHLGFFTPQGLVNLAWAFATAGKEAFQFFAAVEEEVLSRGLQGFNSQDIANLVWAFATTGTEAPELFSAVDKEVLARGLRGFNSQDISNLVWAFAKVEVVSPRLFAAVEAEAVSRGLRDFNEQEIANTAWAFATAGREAPVLFGAVEAEVLGRSLGTFNAQDVANLIWAFAMAGKGTPELFSAVESWVVTRVLRGSSPSHAPVVDRKGCFEQVYMAAEAGKGAWIREGMVEQTAANMLWALAVAGRADSVAGRALLAVWDRLSLLGDRDGRLEPRKLGQVCLYILACVDAGHRAHDRYCCALLQQWQQMATEGPQMPTPLSSDLHQEVSSVLQGMGVDHQNEAPYFHGLLYMDILVNGKVAIEVDGPSHFYQDTGATTAVTLFKRQLLGQSGFQTASVPYLEWRRLKGRQQKEGYLRQKLPSVFQEPSQ